MKVKNYELVKEQIRSFLPQYLNSQGIKKTTSFKCLSSSHEDKNASSGVLPDGTHFHCLGCRITGDIFDACHFLEGRANTGPHFVTENVLYLASLYQVEVEHTEITPEESLELDTYRAYAKAADFLAGTLVAAPPGLVRDELIKRGWDKHTDKWTKAGLGWCKDASALVKELRSLGFDGSFLHDIELDRSDIFNTNNLIFTIKDIHGRPVGFAARNCGFNPADRSEGSIPKYINTSNSVPIYQKRKLLYNLHNAIKSVKASKPLFLMEGYPNVVTSMFEGFENSVAVGGTAITQDHIMLLREQGITNIVLCLDGDKRGQEAVQHGLDNCLSGYEDLNVKVIIIPDNQDPDEFIRAHSIEGFRKLAQWSAFEWRLMRFPEEESPENICKVMIPLIVGEVSYITQEKMCEALAKHTGLPIKAIRAELERLKNVKERKLAQERAIILDGLRRKIEVNPADAEVALHEAASELQKIAEKYDTDKLSPETCLKLLDDQKHTEENKSGDFAGFRLGPDLIPLEEALAGEWKKDVLMCFGGKANAGKTSLLAKIAYEIANIEDNNAVVIFHTIDDTAGQFLPKLVCIAEGSRSLTINEVRDPVYYQETLGIEGVAEKRSIGYSRLRQLMRESRLVLKDANDGNSLSFSESIIRYYRERFPDRRIVYFLDNLHKTQEFGAAPGEERAKFRSISERCKNMATRHHCTVLATVEYTKLAQGIRPTNTNIAETVQIEYDSNFIAHLYNEVHERGEDEAEKLGMTHNVHMKGAIKRLPIIELGIGKNKITDYKNKLYFEFYPASSDFRARNTGEIELMLEAKKKEEQNKKPVKNKLFD